MSTTSLQRARDGRMLCSGHRKSGAPPVHTPGCEACEAARAAGVDRPDASKIPPKLRGRAAMKRKWINWGKIHDAADKRSQLTPQERKAEDAARAGAVEAWLKSRA
jgi:hypothetical protein